MSISLSRAGALLLLLSLGIIMWTLGAQPLISTITDHRNSIIHSQELLAKDSRLIASRSALDAKLREMRVGQNSEGRLLNGSSAQLVGADLQNRIKEMIASHNGTLSSMQMLPVKEENGFRKISVGVTLKANLEALQLLIYTIEAGQPYLFIENLQVRSAPTFANADKTDLLDIQFDVFGYMPGEIG